MNATNAGGTTAWSEVWSFTTIVAAPAVPTLASPANGAIGVSTTPVLSWNAASGADSYGLEVATDAAFTNIVISQTGLTTTAFNVTTALAHNTPYFWRVNATNAGGTTAWSEAWNFTTIAYPEMDV
ncbi:MAG: hypothetical protein ALAOOOJD_02549 [bacterium]|nr:hypothetical protein [bacterium]